MKIEHPNNFEGSVQAPVNLARTSPHNLILHVNEARKWARKQLNQKIDKRLRRTAAACQSKPRRLTSILPRKKFLASRKTPSIKAWARGTAFF